MGDYYDTRANWSGIPEYMRGGIERYVMKGIPPGSFLLAVFSNDLMEAVGRADDVNQHALIAYARFLYNHTPSNCHGSYEAVKAWINRGGLARGAEDESADAEDAEDRSRMVNVGGHRDGGSAS